MVLGIDRAVGKDLTLYVECVLLDSGTVEVRKIASFERADDITSLHLPVPVMYAGEMLVRDAHGKVYIVRE